ncbi:hypothetical protein [Mycoplasma struthionis]|uniref:Uncharacterized protein n=1 Tax=Mycoplasma struthionis TaxID=538220 RepID=A0A3G8LIR2_9MOLU|nr:hypothetical protein [Mycoplasma struthionis]AZG68548.1 hypothetical protein EGN60_00990 [Mycoplasma struthionis]
MTKINEPKYWEFLKNTRKADLVILVWSDFENIQHWKKKAAAEGNKRREAEANEANDLFFKTVNDYYMQKDSILYTALDAFAKIILLLIMNPEKLMNAKNK